MEIPTYTKQYHNDVYPAINASRPELAAKGKRVVVTGGAVGVGAATAEAFAIAGAGEVIILGRTDKTLQAAKTAIEGRHPHSKIVPIATDICDASSVTAAFNTIAKRGPIDIYINNAGYLSDLTPIASASMSEWWKSFDVNLRGSVLTMQEVLKNISPDSGVVINVATAASHIPHMPRQSAYAISKLAAIKVFDYIAFENPGLRVYNLQPGIIGSTGMGTKASTQMGMSFPVQDTGESSLLVWIFRTRGMGAC